MKDGDFLRQVKARYWSAVTYPENMVDDWQTICGDILQYPYCYCIHDKDHLAKYAEKDTEQRKVHVHWIIAFPNTTTYNHALSIFKKLSKTGFDCVNKVEDINGIRNVYEYLIHNTETAKKQEKYQYSPKDRICGNNFDIGSYEQISTKEKDDIRKEMAQLVFTEGFYNFCDLYAYVISNYTAEYETVLSGYSGFFERLTKGQFQKLQFNISEKKK